MSLWFSMETWLSNRNRSRIEPLEPRTWSCSSSSPTPSLRVKARPVCGRSSPSKLGGSFEKQFAIGDHEALYRAGWQLWLAPGLKFLLRKTRTKNGMFNAFQCFSMRFWLDLLSVTPFWIRVIHGGHILPHWERFQMLCRLLDALTEVV